jgi:hypothetical protein
VLTHRDQPSGSDELVVAFGGIETRDPDQLDDLGPSSVVDLPIVAAEMCERRTRAIADELQSVAIFGVGALEVGDLIPRRLALMEDEGVVACTTD